MPKKPAPANTPSANSPASPAAFSGWPHETFTYFDNLEDNNTREWFHANKPDYELFVRAPMELFLSSVEAEFGHSHIFRPQRDTRFSKDKTPYKTNTGAIVDRGADGIYYVHIDQGGLMAASGYYMMASDQIARYREAVDNDKTGVAFAAIVSALPGGTLDHHDSELKRVPPTYPKDHPRGDLLRKKSVTVSTTFGQPDWVHTAKARDHVVKVWRRAADLNGWLRANVGSSVLPPDRR